MNEIVKNIHAIQDLITRTCINIGRKPSEVKLLLATKTITTERIKEALIFNNNLIGENKIQELKQKYPLLKNENLEFHFIGHLQTNKIKDVIKYASCIQSVDRIELARKLDQRLQSEGRSMDILIQVNTSNEESKFGASPENAIALAKEISKLGTLKVKGLMTVGLFSSDEKKVRKCYSLLHEIRTKIADLHLDNTQMEELSMGMSNDIKIAIEEGATIIRVGTAIFGKREFPDSYYWDENQQIV